MNYLYRIYQIVIALPIIIVLTLLTALTTSVGCIIGNGHFWGYYPPVEVSAYGAVPASESHGQGEP